MGEVLPMPGFGDLFTDVRGSDRTMRVSWHPERGAVVLSLWAGTVCRGSFRMAAADVDRLLALLTEIRSSVPVAAGAPPTGPTPPAPERTAPSAAAQPSVEQTGDIGGAAHRLRLAVPPAPRVA